MLVQEGRLGCHRNPSSSGLKRPQVKSGPKPVDPTVDFRLSEGLIDLTNGFSLAGFHGIGGALETPPYTRVSQPSPEVEMARVNDAIGTVARIKVGSCSDTSSDQTLSI